MKIQLQVQKQLIFIMDSYFLIAVVTIIGGVVVLGIKVCFASKCEELDICYGLVSIKRNVIVEEKEFHEENKEDIVCKSF